MEIDETPDIIKPTVKRRSTSSKMQKLNLKKGCRNMFFSILGGHIKSYLTSVIKAKASKLMHVKFLLKDLC